MKKIIKKNETTEEPSRLKSLKKHSLLSPPLGARDRVICLFLPPAPKKDSSLSILEKLKKQRSVFLLGSFLFFGYSLHGTEKELVCVKSVDDMLLDCPYYRRSLLERSPIDFNPQKKPLSSKLSLFSTISRKPTKIFNKRIFSQNLKLEDWLLMENNLRKNTHCYFFHPVIPYSLNTQALKRASLFFLENPLFRSITLNGVTVSKSENQEITLNFSSYKNLSQNETHDSYLSLFYFLRSFPEILQVSSLSIKTKNTFPFYLHECLKRRFFRSFKTLLESHPDSFDLKEQDKEGNTLLHWALFHKKFQIAQNLMTQGISINTQNNLGDTPFHFFLKKIRTSRRQKLREKKNILPFIPENDYPLIDYLIVEGADLKSQNNKGESVEFLLTQVYPDYSFWSQDFELERDFVS